MWSISKRFNVGVHEIKNANNLTSNLISVGQSLVIPGVAPPSQTNVTYVVQKGDSLYSIASKYNTTVDEIKRKMLVKYPFFGSIISNVTFDETKKINTAATNGEVIVYNEDFMNTLEKFKEFRNKLYRIFIYISTWSRLLYW